MADYIALEVPDGEAEAYVTGTAGPGVLLYMDAIGLRPQIERMADRIASWGYVVLAPNVFWRDGSVEDLAPRSDLRVPENREAFMASGVMDRVRSISADVVCADAEEWIDALRGIGGAADGPIATTGYCFGGRLALRTAAHLPDDVAVVGMFHTGGIVTDAPDSPHLDLPGAATFVLAGHADADRSNSPEQIEAFDGALDAAGVPRRTAVYPGAVHGYTMADTAAYDESSAERHYDELREALDRALKSS
ncbi:dienelactone hydrolase family protein [Nocardioides sp. WS12]|uniref:dienelactone hydrolase family protein n=1 Tax=Nocardioides sp. WS12 TaxID=2486272 RepID=UPI0015F9D1C1|nr:dienelactone hydrolase family protein [Nocardioides sp. WS12]